MKTHFTNVFLLIAMVAWSGCGDSTKSNSGTTGGKQSTQVGTCYVYNWSDVRKTCEESKESNSEKNWNLLGQTLYTIQQIPGFYTQEILNSKTFAERFEFLNTETKKCIIQQTCRR